jgi:threonine dehydratase
MDIRNEVLKADKRIRPHIRETPLDRSEALSEMARGNVLLKLENLQLTGSFKVRGAMNKLLSLAPEERAGGVVAASTGNHGAAVAFGAGKLGMKALIFAPEQSSPTKVDAVRRLGALVRFHGTDCVDAESFARQYAVTHNMPYVSPYNDPIIVGGQGTVGLEIDNQLSGIDAVLVTLGGGGLISGIAGYLKSMRRNVRIIGCSPENSAVMAESIKAGRILEIKSRPTLSEGSAGGVEQGAITFDLCKELVDDYVNVSESEIVHALKFFMEAHHMMIEGAAAVSIAALLKTKDKFRGQNAVVVVCGANIGLETLKSIL